MIVAWGKGFFLMGGHSHMIGEEAGEDDKRDEEVDNVVNFNATEHSSCFLFVVITLLYGL